jgi:ATP-dependent RNA helicase RhlE
MTIDAATFEDLKLHHKLLKNLAANGYKRPTTIQRLAIPRLRTGVDVIGRAETGAGKTAAMLLPLLDALVRSGKRSKDETERLREAGRWGVRGPRVLVIEPTHELVDQVAVETTLLSTGTGLKVLALHAGAGEEGQAKALRKRVDVLVATPGRLVDHLLEWNVDLAGIEHVVIDEADRLCDMGFQPDVRRILRQTSRARQSLFFSATMPPHVEELADELTRAAETIETTEREATPETIELELHRLVERQKLRHLLSLLDDPALKRVLIFVRRRSRAREFHQVLAKRGVAARVLHGDKSPGMRRQALEELKTGDIRAVVATDLGARGLHIEGLTHVINVDVPLNAEQFLHRVGRTGRMGATGEAITFCAPEETPAWEKIRKRFHVKAKIVQVD